MSRTMSKTAGTAPRLAQDDTPGVLGTILQGAGFIGFLLVLFYLAGFRG